MLGMMKRIIGFKKHDWQHLMFLVKNIFNQAFIKFNWNEVVDTFFWIKIHLQYDSEKVD